MQYSVKKIIDLIVEYKKLNDIKELNSFLCLSDGLLYGWISRNKIAKPHKILAKIPELNEKWVTTGIGPMLRDATPEVEEQGLQLKEPPGIEYETMTVSVARKEVITSLKSVISFLEDTYIEYPHHMDIVVNDMKGYLRENYETFREWEKEQIKKFIETKKQEGLANPNGFLESKSANGS